jgi:hypothetical protein
MKISPLSLPAALMLVACGPVGGSAKEQAVVEIEAVPDSEIPTDGTVHVVKRGRFVIGPETLFCTYRPGFGVDGTMLSNALKSMGQSDRLKDTPKGNGASRSNRAIGPNHDNPDCVKGNPVLIRGIQALNRAGKPYRLTLVVRQGDALWQGVLERADGKLHPDAFGIADDMPGNNPDDFGSSAEVDSINRDMHGISLEFTNNLKGIPQ